MSIDREAALKKAEKLLRQGKLTGAIEEYVRLIGDQPRDVGAINALGDLYVRAGEIDRAVAQFTRAADQLAAEGFLPDAQAMYQKALRADHQHEHTLSQLATIAGRQGHAGDAMAYLRRLSERRRLRGDERGVAECVERMRALDGYGADGSSLPAMKAEAPVPVEPEDAGMVLAAAARELASGNELQGRAALMRALTLDPAQHVAVVRIALDLLAQGRIETAFGCVDVAADAALLSGNLTQAIEVLQTFVRAAPHVPALVKLVELCVEAALDGPLRAAQTQLADAYLDTGRGAEARVIAEDLLEHDPECEAHAQRVRRAMALLGVPHGDRTVIDVRGRSRDVDAANAARRRVTAQGGHEQPGIDPGRVSSDVQANGADNRYERARTHLQEGRLDEAIADLREAARTPHTRVKASAELGRVFVRLGDLPAAVEWLERAADGRSESREEAFAVLFDLADTLERLGESARALAVLVDLEADAGDYRNVRKRIEQLVRAQGSHQA